MEGEGRFEWVDGRKFQGCFSKGVMHGHGVYTWKDGRRYEGEYFQNKKHGQGVYTYSDGSKYSGAWENGLQHGLGRIIEPNSNFQRKGIWQEGKILEWQGVEPV